MRKSFVEDTKIDLASVEHLPKVPNIVEYLIDPKFVTSRLAGNVAKWIAFEMKKPVKLTDIAKGTRF